MEMYDFESAELPSPQTPSLLSVICTGETGKVRMPQSFTNSQLQCLSSENLLPESQSSRWEMQLLIVTAPAPGKTQKMGERAEDLL